MYHIRKHWKHIKQVILVHCPQRFRNSHVALSAHTTKTRVVLNLHFLLGSEDLAVDFIKFSNTGETFFIRCFTVTDVSQSTEYFLILSAKPEPKLEQLAMIGLLKMPLSILIANHD